MRVWTSTEELANGRPIVLPRSGVIFFNLLIFFSLSFFHWLYDVKMLFLSHVSCLVSVITVWVSECVHFVRLCKVASCMVCLCGCLIRCVSLCARVHVLIFWSTFLFSSRSWHWRLINGLIPSPPLWLIFEWSLGQGAKAPGSQLCYCCCFCFYFVFPLMEFLFIYILSWSDSQRQSWFELVLYPCRTRIWLLDQHFGQSCSFHTSPRDFRATLQVLWGRLLRYFYGIEEMLIFSDIKII